MMDTQQRRGIEGDPFVDTGAIAEPAPARRPSLWLDAYRFPYRRHNRSESLRLSWLVLGLVAIVSLIAFIESGFRGQLPRLIASVTIGLAVVSALVLLFEFFWLIVVLAVLVAGGYIMWENLRELSKW